MSLNNAKETEMRRNARWLLRLTALAGANIFAGGAGRPKRQRQKYCIQQLGK